jgi:hypothetical protein
MYTGERKIIIIIIIYLYVKERAGIKKGKNEMRAFE